MKKVGMVIFSYPLGISSFLISSAVLFARAGYEVNIFIDRLGFERSKAKFQERNIIVHQIEDAVNTRFSSGIWGNKIPVFHKGKIKKVPAGNIYQFVRLRLMLGLNKLYLIFKPNGFPSLLEKLNHYTRFLFINLFDFSQSILKYADDDYVCIIGVEPNGVIAAHLFADEKKIPVIYYNMELLLEQDCKTTQEKALKYMERTCSKESYLTIIADERRAKHLIADNDLAPEKIVYVPVSTLGEPYRKKSDYLYRTLGIAKNKKILLCAGNIIQWSMSLELAQAAQKWSDDLVLVLHTWRPEAKKEAYVHQIEKLTASGKVYLSLNPVEWETLPELLSSADIGLIFYQNLGPNFSETVLSSNKMAQYLQVGLPVITSDYPSFKEVIEGYKCGKCAGNPEEIERLAGEILQEYETFCSNAIKCYQENYDLSKHFNAVLAKIKAIERKNSKY